MFQHRITSFTMLRMRAFFQTNRNLHITKHQAKKKSRNEIDSYRPISILPNLSKIFETCMHDQPKFNLIKNYQNIRADLEKVLAHNIAY